MNIETIKSAIEEAGYKVRQWEGSDRTRLYLIRFLSRGRRQEMGYVEFGEGEEVGYGLTRQAGLIRQIVEKAR